MTPVHSHLHEGVPCANQNHPFVTSADCTSRRQHEFHELAQHLQELIHEVDEPLRTF